MEVISIKKENMQDYGKKSSTDVYSALTPMLQKFVVLQLQGIKCLHPKGTYFAA